VLVRQRQEVQSLPLSGLTIGANRESHHRTAERSGTPTCGVASGRALLLRDPGCPGGTQAGPRLMCRGCRAGACRSRRRSQSHSVRGVVRAVGPRARIRRRFAISAGGEAVAVTRRPRYTKEEFARRGNEIDQQHIRSLVEPDHRGEFVAIDIESGEWEVGSNALDVCDRLIARQPDCQTWLVRVGFPYVHRMGGHDLHRARR
jgi:hypothetical protein